MYALHTTLHNILRNPYEAPLVFPVHRYMLRKPCIPIHHYSPPKDVVRGSTHRVQGIWQSHVVPSGHYVNGTDNPRSIHVASQRPRYSHFTDYIDFPVRTKHPFIQEECLPSLLLLLSTESHLKAYKETNARISYYTAQYLAQSVRSTPSSLGTVACYAHSCHEVCILDCSRPSPHNVHSTVIARVACTPQSVRSTPSYNKNAYPLCCNPLSFYSTLLLHSSHITYCKTHTGVNSRIYFPLRMMYPFLPEE